jgi:hypothetical protein
MVGRQVSGGRSQEKHLFCDPLMVGIEPVAL